MLLTTNKTTTITKSELALKLGVSRSSLYYQPKRPIIDAEVKSQIESVLTTDHSYGHKRIALELKLNKKRILRVMKKFGIKPYRRRKTPRKPGDEGKTVAKFKNLIESFCPIRPNVVWVSDFTLIRYQEKFIYLATIMDMFTREVVGWNISRFHNQTLVLGALDDAMRRNNNQVPSYLHSDQGSEYDAQIYTETAESLKIKISMSRKSHPWENAFQESFYDKFKVDFGDPDRFETLGELVAEIHQQINYYNQRRIHTALKMSPIKFRLQYYSRVKTIGDNVFKEMGT